VAIWWKEWKTSSTWSYVLTLLGMFLAGVLVELIRRLNMSAHRRYMVSKNEFESWTLSHRLGAKAIRALLHLAHITVGYLVMLAVMSYNVGVFVAVMLGFGVGFFLLAENHLPADHPSGMFKKRAILNGDCVTGEMDSQDFGNSVNDETPLLEDATGFH
jgi:copper transporter 1